jgi:hypothetical protein
MPFGFCILNHEARKDREEKICHLFSPQDLAKTITTMPKNRIFFVIFAVLAVQILMWLIIRSSRVVCGDRIQKFPGWKCVDFTDSFIPCLKTKKGLLCQQSLFPISDTSVHTPGQSIHHFTGRLPAEIRYHSLSQLCLRQLYQQQKPPLQPQQPGRAKHRHR